MGRLRILRDLVSMVRLCPLKFPCPVLGSGAGLPCFDDLLPTLLVMRCRFWTVGHRDQSHERMFLQDRGYPSTGGVHNGEIGLWQVFPKGLHCSGRTGKPDFRAESKML